MVLAAEAQLNGSFLSYSHYQTSDSAFVGDGAVSDGVGETWLVSSQRLYYLSLTSVLTAMSVEVASGGELVAPAQLSVVGVTLTVDGTLTGVEELAVGDGGTVSFGSTGRTSGERTKASSAPATDSV